MPGRLRCLAAIPFLLALPFASAWAQDAAIRVDPTPPAHKSAFTPFDPTPAADLRGFTSDRPTKSYSPITVDAVCIQPISPSPGWSRGPSNSMPASMSA